MEQDWALNVDATAKDIQAITVIDRLIGGLSYQFDVNAVTEAGEGGRSASSFVLAKMPILGKFLCFIKNIFQIFWLNSSCLILFLNFIFILFYFKFILF